MTWVIFLMSTKPDVCMSSVAALVPTRLVTLIYAYLYELPAKLEGKYFEMCNCNFYRFALIVIYIPLEHYL